MVTGKEKLLGISKTNAVTGELSPTMIIFDSFTSRRISKWAERCAGFTQLCPPLHGGFANDDGYDFQVGVNVSV